MSKSFLARRAREAREEAEQLERQAGQHERNGHPDDATELLRQAAEARANAQQLRAASKRGAR